MTLSWPGSLPQEFLLEGYDTSLRSQSVTSPSGVGSVQVRAISLARIWDTSGTLSLTSTQYADLLDFYSAIGQAAGGANAFTWTRTSIGAERTCKFLAPPGPPQWVTPTRCRVSITIEERE